MKNYVKNIAVLIFLFMTLGVTYGQTPSRDLQAAMLKWTSKREAMFTSKPISQDMTYIHLGGILVKRNV